MTKRFSENSCCRQDDTARSIHVSTKKQKQTILQHQANSLFPCRTLFMCCAAAVDSPLLASRRQTSTFSLSRQSSNVSVSVSVAHHEPAEDGAFGRQASVASTVNSEAQGAAHIGAGEVGGHFMQPLTDMNFLLVRTSMIRVCWCVCVCVAFFVCTALVC